MNKKYVDPEMTLSLFDCEDVITASGFAGEDDEDLPYNYPNMVNLK